MCMLGCGCPGLAHLELRDVEGHTSMSACVDVLTDEADLRVGLRGREELEVGHGVLLEFPLEAEICIFNDGVRWDIDAVFVDPEARVVAVERAVPASDGSARCHAGVQRVIEVHSGEADAVRVGDRLVLD